MYHVTHKEKAENIWNNGIVYNPPSERWVHERSQLRKDIDKLANEFYTDWVNRENAVFFWPTFESARRYAKKISEPAIVELTNKPGNCWCVKSSFIEELHHDYTTEYLSGKISREEIESRIRSFIESANRWKGVHANRRRENDKIEVWTNPPIEEENIHQIYNIDQSILQFNK